MWLCVNQWICIMIITWFKKALVALLLKHWQSHVKFTHMIVWPKHQPKCPVMQMSVRFGQALIARIPSRQYLHDVALSRNLHMATTKINWIQILELICFLVSKTIFRLTTIDQYRYEQLSTKQNKDLSNLSMC